MKKGTIKFKFQCLACLALTQIETKKPRRFKPLVLATGVCHDCKSESDLRILFVPEGMKVSTLTMRLTYEGREAFYVNNPELDPDNINNKTELVSSHEVESHQPSSNDSESAELPSSDSLTSSVE